MQIKKNVLNQNVLKNLKRNSCEKLEQNENLANTMNELLKNSQDLIEIESCKNEIEKLKSRIQSSEEIMNQQDYEIKQLNNDNIELLKQS